jgi:AGZA family xanthine/uracil permease-like MFS transporter
LFVAYIGLKNGGIIVTNEATMTALGPWNGASLLAMAGILLGTILMALKIRGALFYTIIGITLIGIPFGVTKVPEGFSLVSMPVSISSIALQFDFSRFFTFDIEFYIAVFTLLFMDLFDTLGTLIGASTSAGMVDKNGRIHGLNKALMADAVGTTVGALCGTSTVTTYVESATGIAEGGRTGLTSFTVACLFLVSLFFSPLFLIIPSAATTSALVLVGVLMMKTVTKIDFSDITESLPCFITIVMMPFTASISEGIVLGMLSYVTVKLLSGKWRQLGIVIYALAALFLLKYIVAFI